MSEIIPGAARRGASARAASFWRRRGRYLVGGMAFLLFAAAAAPLSAAALDSTCSAQPFRARLNELKGQGGGSGTRFVEILILGVDVPVQNWEIGYGDKNDASASYVALGAGNCRVNGSTTDPDSPPSRTYSYPTFISCEVPSQHSDWGEWILKDNTGRSNPLSGVMDYLRYSSTASCPTPTFFKVPTGGCVDAAASCVANFDPSSSDIARSPDGTGGWTEDIAGFPSQGTSNNDNLAPGLQMLRNFAFAPVSGSYCVNTDNTIKVEARDISTAIKTNYVGTVLVSSSTALSGFPKTLAYAPGDAGQKSLTLNLAAPATFTLSAVDSVIAGTISTSGVYTFAACVPSFLEVVQPNATSNNSPLLTQRAGQDFALELRALDSARALQSSYTGTVELALVDAGSYDGSNCAALPVLPGSTTTPVTLAPLDGGKKAVTFRYDNAARNVRVRSTDAARGVSTCSADNFAIRPDYFAITPDTTIDTPDNGVLPAGDKLPAGANFSLTAAPMRWSAVTGEVPLGTGYNGTPLLAAASVRDHAGVAIAAGTLVDTDAIAGLNFPAAVGAASSGTFQYNDVGTIKLDAGAVSDALFTAVDQVYGTQTVNGITLDHGAAGDCVAGASTYDLASAPFGCTIGSRAGDAWGRFVPDHYAVTTQLDAGCAAGGFTYMDHDALTLQVEARAMGATSPTPLSRYTNGYAHLATLTLSAENAGVAIPLARLSSPGLSPAIWAQGAYPAAATSSPDVHRFDARNASPVVLDGAYDSFRLKVAIVDADGRKITRHTHGPIAAGVNEVLASGVGEVYSDPTKIRYGRLQLSNAFGSEKLPLRVPLRAEYWTGTYWTINRADVCTELLTAASGSPSVGTYAPAGHGDNAAGNTCFGACSSATTVNTTIPGENYAGTVLLSNPTGAAMTALSTTPTYPAQAPDSTTLNAGTLGLSFSAPLTTGSLQLRLAAPDWLKFNGADPQAKLSFGIYKGSNRLIFRRELR